MYETNSICSIDLESREEMCVAFTHCLDRTPDCTFLGTGLLLPRWRTGKPARGRYIFITISSVYEWLFNTIDRTCERHMHFFNQVWYPFLKNHIGSDMVV